MSEFCPKNQFEWDFKCWLSEKEGYVSIDRVISGQGIASWYEFMKYRGVCASNPEIDAAFEASSQPAAVVSENGKDKNGDELCVKVID
jgi:glucokinase